jgi:coproporphyrinogen III oxidase-like Fe-S oxidoreductase
MQPNHITMRFNPLPTLLKFDRQLPVYNWLYPFESQEQKMADPLSVYRHIEPRSRLRALYFHVPFCDTICSFCPFTRGQFENEDEVDRYVQALLREIEIKHEHPAINASPVDCIYFGGGTPSILRVEHFYQIGEALHRYFDLSQLKELTMECEVKSVTLEKLKAFQQIGVNRISFGVQTFHPVYRELFAMTATVDQIRRVAEWVNERFPSTNVDMIHGMAGQTLDDFLMDVDQVNALGMTTVDYYTLNNVASQLRLHRAFAQRGMKPLSANTKVSYRMFLNEYLRAQGYVPHNSYSFTRNRTPAGTPRMVVQRDPIFLYQEIAYGFADDYVDGYGAGALSQFGSYLVYNIGNREQYAARLLGDQQQPWFSAYSDCNVAAKGIIYFPYRGVLEKSRIAWEQVHPQTRATLEESVACGMAIDRGDVYELTEAGWLFAVNYMYALLPPSDQALLSNAIARASSQQDRQPDDLMFFPPNRRAAPALPAA